MTSAPDIPDDRTTRARIRDAAMQCIATAGVAATTARKVAALADVSPGSVIHHFGSMEGLKKACDDYLLAVVRDAKTDAMRQGPDFDLASGLRGYGHPHLLKYLAAILTEDTSATADLVDSFVADAEVYIQEGIASGMLEPSVDPRGRAVILTMWNFGMLALHRHLERLIGTDLTDPDLASSRNLHAYLVPIMEIYGGGIFTDEFMDNARAALAAMAADTGPGHPAPRERNQR